MPFKNQPPLYHVWRSMKDRCYNPNYLQYADYGGRGIRVCDRWVNDYAAFEADMSPRPEGYSIDRIDNDGDYSPDNCRWADRKTQQRNQRRAVFVEIDGQRHRAIELAETYGLKTDTIIQRASLGLSFEEVTSNHRRVFTDGLALGGLANGARQQSKTHCPQGHEYNERNTYITPQGWRNCRACKAAKQRARNARKKA